MKTRRHRKLGISILAVACAALTWAAVIPAEVSAAGKTPPALVQKTQQAGRLIITRSANLGAYAVGLSIDGVQTATINFNGRYDAPLAAGKHTLSVIPIPNRQAGKATQTQITVLPGKSYSFTAKRDNDDYVLR